MPALDLTDLTVANTLVPELTGFDTAPLDLDTLLENSAATHTSDSVTVYRPYYVAARLLARVPNTSRLRAARGATFDPPTVRIRELRQQQAASDEAVLEEHSDYTIPAGHEVGSGFELTF